MGVGFIGFLLIFSSGNIYAFIWKCKNTITVMCYLSYILLKYFLYFSIGTVQNDLNF